MPSLDGVIPKGRRLGPSHHYSTVTTADLWPCYCGAQVYPGTSTICITSSRACEKCSYSVSTPGLLNQNLCMNKRSQTWTFVQHWSQHASCFLLRLVILFGFISLLISCCTIFFADWVGVSLPLVLWFPLFSSIYFFELLLQTDWVLRNQGTAI